MGGQGQELDPRITVSNGQWEDEGGLTDVEDLSTAEADYLAMMEEEEEEPVSEGPVLEALDTSYVTVKNTEKYGTPFGDPAEDEGIEAPSSS
jgi:hypothetical protein